jgi:hypothetical protein
MSELVLYTSDDGRTRLDLRIEGQTAWLTQAEIAELFQTTKQNVSLHAKNIFEDGELAEDSVVKDSLTTAADGKRYQTKLYNLDLILAIGYRVRSPRGVQFRQWASFDAIRKSSKCHQLTLYLPPRLPIGWEEIPPKQKPKNWIELKTTRGLNNFAANPTCELFAHSGMRLLMM